ncbi:MAG TPA: hypothetical protein VNC85_11290 [Mycobacteriales bacterium]|nr:hypothetical protein [Mycobacteriales bacterium]
MRRHELDVFSLVAGLVFVAVAIGHLLDEGAGLDFDGLWVAPVVLVALGAAGLGGVLRGREPQRPADNEVEVAPDADGM